MDDGAFLMTRILIALAKCSKEGKKLTDLIADLEMPKEEKEVRLRFVDGCDFKKMGAKILKDYEQHVKDMHYIEAAPDNYEGCRANYDWKHGDGWTLVRMSLHEPILPINMESDSFFGVLKMLKDLYYFLKDYSCLDVTPLREAIESERERLINLIKTRYRANPQWLYFLFY